MRKLSIYIILILMAACPVAVHASCYSDRIVSRWLEERDELAVRVLQDWAAGAAVEELSSDIAAIMANEVITCSKCSNDGAFIQENLFILTGETEPDLNKVPAIILEHFLGKNLLSPYVQFPGNKTDIGGGR